ncbi:hypothetical protein [Geodermatophilus sp. URMC 65]
MAGGGAVGVGPHRAGRDESDRLVAARADQLPAYEPVVETDRWTLWTGSLRS